MAPPNQEIEKEKKALCISAAIITRTKHQRLFDASKEERGGVVSCRGDLGMGFWFLVLPRISLILAAQLNLLLAQLRYGILKAWEVEVVGVFSNFETDGSLKYKLLLSSITSETVWAKSLKAYNNTSLYRNLLKYRIDIFLWLFAFPPPAHIYSALRPVYGKKSCQWWRDTKTQQPPVDFHSVLDSPIRMLSGRSHRGQLAFRQDCAVGLDER